MNSIPGREPRADTLDINQPKETHKKGLLLGTDFRHAVEFSRSGRARNPANPLALVRGGFSTLRHLPRESSPGVSDLGHPVSGGDPSATGGSQEAFPRPARLLGVRHPVRPA